MKSAIIAIVIFLAVSSAVFFLIETVRANKEKDNLNN